MQHPPPPIGVRGGDDVTFQTLHHPQCAVVTTTRSVNPPPNSQPTTEHENAAAQAEMEAEIESLNLDFYPGQGEDPTGQWAAEPSALVMGIGLERTARNMPPLVPSEVSSA